MRTSEQIISAYAKYGIWYELKRFINESGWCRKYHNKYPEIKKEHCGCKPHWWRPIELKY